MTRPRISNADMQQIDVIIKRHKWGWIGRTLRKDESSLIRQAMQWTALDVIGEERGDPARREDELGKGNARI